MASDDEWVDSDVEDAAVAARTRAKMHSVSVKTRWQSVFGSDTSSGSDGGLGDDAVQPEDTATAAATPAASSPALVPADVHYMTLAAINVKKVVELKAACLEHNLQQTGNKRHLQHRLLRLCGHIPWNTPPPPGGSRAERAAATFFAPGHDTYDTNNFMITTGVNGEPSPPSCFPCRDAHHPY